MIDLWPNNLDIPTSKPPVTILREQAAFLGQKTDNIVQAKVRNTTQQGGVTFEYQLFLQSDAIGYSYRILAIVYTIEFYPVAFILDTDIQEELSNKKILKKYEVTLDERISIRVNSEEEFLGLLAEILKTEKIRQIIVALLAQASDAKSMAYEGIPF
ncbi:hypothetical protein C7293_06215 [filamentous cyanobacterium CCT1]|nr:hypothetical protein C7293_06215 [filamentous cyanobacterium CCT1]PSN79205.1 hypothetical protein C8B47_12950 [filamentous cyanobacterium CCP4]